MTVRHLFGSLTCAAAILVKCASSDALAGRDEGSGPSRAVAEPQRAAPRSAAESGFSLALSEERQRQSGLQTRRLDAHSRAEETHAYGRILDLRPLLDLRARYRSAQSETTIADAALRVASKNRDRLAKLHSESIVPARELIQAESQLAADQARHAAGLRHVREVREEALQTFGEELCRQALEEESGLLRGLLHHSILLALVALPARQTLPKNVHSIGVNPAGDRAKARTASLIAPAPRTEESTQGETWFFAVPSLGLRTGMRLDAWIPLDEKASQGVLIPHSAIVWRDGRPWAFVKIGPESFVRRPIAAYREHGDDWFVTSGFAPGEEAVVVGAQMLSSEEQRRTAPATADDNND